MPRRIRKVEHSHSSEKSGLTEDGGAFLSKVENVMKSLVQQWKLGEQE